MNWMRRAKPSTMTLTSIPSHSTLKWRQRPYKPDSAVACSYCRGCEARHRAQSTPRGVSGWTSSRTRSCRLRVWCAKLHHLHYREAKLIGDIALIVTAIGVLGVVLGLRQNYRERLRQFQGMYVERYWMNLDKLSIDALSGSFPDKITEDDDKAIRSYILLCEDELEMRENGYIAPTAVCR